MSVPSKGLNFIPVSKQSDEAQAKKDAKNVFRRARLKPSFTTLQVLLPIATCIFERLNPCKSNWVPPDGQFVSLDLFQLTSVAMTSPMSI